MSPADVRRLHVLSFRVRAQQQDRAVPEVQDAAILDIGVQDTGPDAGTTRHTTTRRLC